MTKLPKPVKTIAASNSPLPYKTITGEDFSQRSYQNLELLPQRRKERKVRKFNFFAFFASLREIILVLAATLRR